MDFCICYAFYRISKESNKHLKAKNLPEQLLFLMRKMPFF